MCLSIVFKDWPGDAAVHAILVHELKHLEDFTHMTSLQIIGLGKKYTGRQPNADVAKYDRATDLWTLSVGEADGLIEYRNWLYPHLNARQLILKEIYYYTPEEIQKNKLEHGGRGRIPK